jgi:hypothetical protein
MKTHVSLTGLSAAIMLFAIAAAMHEAASADRLTAPGVSLVAERLVTKHGKKPLGFKGSGGTSRTVTCTHGEDDITHCNDCDSDGVCILDVKCYKGSSGEVIPCP